MELARELPHSNDAEVAVLGSIFIEPKLIIDAIDVIKPEHFYSERNRLIFGAMYELFQTGVPIDAVTVGHYLEKQGVFDAIGGQNYLKDILASIPIPDNVKSYSQYIKEAYLLRCLIKTSDEITSLCYGGDNVPQIMDLAVAKIFDVVQQRDNQSVTNIRSCKERYLL